MKHIRKHHNKKMKRKINAVSAKRKKMKLLFNKSNVHLTPRQKKIFNLSHVLRSSARTGVLSKTQREILELAKRGHSIFITGSAGTGKSHLLRSIINELKIVEDNVYVTAPSGIAASNIDGTTIHSFGGIGFGDLDKNKLFVLKKN